MILQPIRPGRNRLLIRFFYYDKQSGGWRQRGKIRLPMVVSLVKH